MTSVEAIVYKLLKDNDIDLTNEKIQELQFIAQAFVSGNMGGAHLGLYGLPKEVLGTLVARLQELLQPQQEGDMSCNGSANPRGGAGTAPFPSVASVSSSACPDDFSAIGNATVNTAALSLSNYTTTTTTVQQSTKNNNDNDNSSSGGADQMTKGNSAEKKDKMTKGGEHADYTDDDLCDLLLGNGESDQQQPLVTMESSDSFADDACADDKPDDEKQPTKKRKTGPSSHE